MLGVLWEAGEVYYGDYVHLLCEALQDFGSLNTLGLGGDFEVGMGPAEVGGSWCIGVDALRSEASICVVDKDCLSAGDIPQVGARNELPLNCALGDGVLAGAQHRVHRGIAGRS